MGAFKDPVKKLQPCSFYKWQEWIEMECRWILLGLWQVHIEKLTRVATSELFPWDNRSGVVSKASFKDLIQNQQPMFTDAQRVPGCLNNIPWLIL